MIPKRKTLTPAPAKAVAAMAAASADAAEGGGIEVDLSSLEAIDLSAQDILEVVDIASSGLRKAVEPGASAVELSESDFVLLTPSPVAVPIPGSVIPSAEQSKSNLRAALAEVKPPSERVPRKTNAPAASLVPVTSPVKKRPPMGLSWEEEADVAESCLASIAEQTARVRGSDPFLRIAPPPTGPIDPRPSAPAMGDVDAETRETLPASSRRLPPINPPPFIVRKEPLPPRSSRSSTFARSVSDSRPSVSDLSTLPIGVRTPFARTLTDNDHADRISATSLAPSVRPPTKSASSFPPLSMDSYRDLAPGAPALVSPRRGGATTRTYRPRTAWILASAIVGLIGAVVATKWLDPSSPPTPTSPAAQVVPSTPVIAPTGSSHTVVFKENEGVSIPAAIVTSPSRAIVPTTQPSPQQAQPKQGSLSHPVPLKPVGVAQPRPSAQPKVSAPTPLVDGTLGMANNKPTTVRAGDAPSPKPVATPEPSSARKKLTPEQELAEAQLRAAMK